MSRLALKSSKIKKSNKLKREKRNPYFELYIFRHGIAEDRRIFSLLNKNRDSDRPLTQIGAKKFRKFAKKMASIIGPIDTLLTSPYVRAVQTADLFQTFFPELKIVKNENLVPHADVVNFLEEWRKNVKVYGRRIVVFGHEPHLSTLIGWLVYEKAESRIELKKGACAALRFKKALLPGGATLCWLMSPKMVSCYQRGP